MHRLGEGHVCMYAGVCIHLMTLVCLAFAKSIEKMLPQTRHLYGNIQNDSKLSILLEIKLKIKQIFLMVYIHNK